IENGLVAGFTSAGVDVLLLGPVPTPAVAMLTRSMRCDLGVMISASHNPFHDNGIKLFGPDGHKMSDADEEQIEKLIDSDLGKRLAGSKDLGRARRIDGASERYVEFAKRTLPRTLALDGIRAVIDCANGAAYRVEPTVLRELGAEVIAVGVEPNGMNINKECGATAPAAMCEAVVAHGAHLGIALDGDADRLILADEKGQVLDGDQLMALIARSWAAEGRLTGNGVVATVMSNLGLERFLAGLGLKLDRAPVGDRYVVENMRAGGFNLGGEQSGHIILSDYVTTGDGLIAALQVLAVLMTSDRPASEVGRVFAPLPQQLTSLRVVDGATPLETAPVKEAIRAGEAALQGRGRLLIRKSGTEPVIRVMAEGDDEGLVLQVIDDVARAIEAAGRA
ncbi:MAG TPA: phosphoglucosamine mutase, partial [Dongiaceae bacterium]